MNVALSVGEGESNKVPSLTLNVDNLFNMQAFLKIYLTTNLLLPLQPLYYRQFNQDFKV